MPRDITVTFDDGSTHVYRGAPDNITPEQVTERASKDFGRAVTALDGGKNSSGIAQTARDLAAGAIRGAGSIGATLLWPIDKATDLIKGDRGPNVTGLVTGAQPLSRNEERRKLMDEALANPDLPILGGTDLNSLAFKGGKLAGEIAGTAGAGGVAGNAIARVAPMLGRAAPAVNAIADATRTAGFTGANMATRATGGAINGLISAGMVNPDDALTGAAVGGALPGATKIAGFLGKTAGELAGAAGRKIVGEVAPEVKALAQRAKELGIDIPADRLVSSKPLDALASGLNYVPFSGRAATEAKMGEQLNQAASRLMGQDTPNITKAVRDASKDLGAKFDATLRGNGVQFDKQLLTDLSEKFNAAQRELGADSLRPIAAQIDDLMEKGATGVIDGQAAYNIKRTLDRIGSSNRPEAYHALELKGALMDALNRSLGPEKAAAFAETRKQYGNMLALEKIAKNGAEGDISVARLANMRNINNSDLQELADIAAQFVKAREGQHGSMQRAVVGLGTASTAGLPGLAVGAAAGRAANMALNSNAARNAVLGIQGPQSAITRLLTDPKLNQLAYRVAPGLVADR